jgi:drug/metabolite transporter (DMT)-like permease
MSSDVGGYVFEAISLGIGSLILVEPMLAMSLPFSLLLGRWLQHRTIDRNGWVSAALLAIGVGSFLYEVAPNGGTQTAPIRDWIGACVPVLLVIAVCILLARTATIARRAMYLGIAAGAAFAISAVLTKAFVHYLGEGVFAWVPHWEPYALAVSAIGGLVCSQSAFQTGVLPAAVGAEQVMQPTVGVLLGAVLLHEELSASGRLDFAVVVLAIIAMAYGVVGVTRAEYSEVVEPAIDR